MPRKTVILGKSVTLPVDWPLKTEKQQKLWIRYQQSKMKKIKLKAEQDAKRQQELF